MQPPHHRPDYSMTECRRPTTAIPAGTPTAGVTQIDRTVPTALAMLRMITHLCWRRAGSGPGPASSVFLLSQPMSGLTVWDLSLCTHAHASILHVVLLLSVHERTLVGDKRPSVHSRSRHSCFAGPLCMRSLRRRATALDSTERRGTTQAIPINSVLWLAWNFCIQPQYAGSELAGLAVMPRPRRGYG